MPVISVNVILSFVAAAIIAFAATPLVKVFAGKIGAIDVPKDARRMHKVPIPRLGGLAIFMGFLVAVLLFVDIDYEMRGILLGSVVIVFVGVIDDIVQLPAVIKLIGQILAAFIPVLHGVRMDIITNFNVFSDKPYISLGILSIPITIIWIVGITNAVNLIDGLDGLAVGVSFIASFSLLLIALVASEPQLAIITAALAGACMGFLPFNFNPARIFMGDTGAMFLGFILSTISIQGLFKFYAVISFAVPFLILGLPIFDTTFAIIRRLLEGRSPMSPDRGHLHHRLIDMGFSQKQTVAILYSMSGLLGLSAVVLTSTGALKALILIFAVLAVAIIAYAVFLKEEHKKHNPEDGEFIGEHSADDNKKEDTPDKDKDSEEKEKKD